MSLSQKQTACKVIEPIRLLVVATLVSLLKLCILNLLYCNIILLCARTWLMNSYISLI